MGRLAGELAAKDSLSPLRARSKRINSTHIICDVGLTSDPRRHPVRRTVAIGIESTRFFRLRKVIAFNSGLSFGQVANVIELRVASNFEGHNTVAA